MKGATDRTICFIIFDFAILSFKYSLSLLHSFVLFLKSLYVFYDFFIFVIFKFLYVSLCFYMFLYSILCLHVL